MALSQIEQVRLYTGQDADFNFLTDEEIQHFLDTYGSVRLATLQAARTILFKLSRNVRQRVEMLEWYGKDAYNSYLESLNMLLKDNQFSDLSVATPYAGGISNSDIEANISDTDNHIVDIKDSEQSRSDLEYVSDPSDPFGS